MSKLLKKEMDTFVRTHTKFVAEVPSFRGETVISMPANYISPYISLPNISSLTLDAGLLIKSNSIIAEEAALIFSRIHEVLHVQACEVVVFMICCKDRIQDGIVPNTIPLAYALKGKSLSNVQLHYMINKLRNILKEKGIDVLGECYDGQWQNTVMNSQEGNPLTLLRLQNSTWSRVSKLSRCKILEEMQSTLKVPNGDRDLLTITKFPVGKHTLLNVEIEKHYDGSLSCSSLGDPYFKQPIGNLLIGMTKKELEEDYPLDGDVKPSPVVNTKRMIGLQHGECSIIAALPQEIIAEFGHVTDTTEVSCEEEDTLPDLVNNESNLERLLTEISSYYSKF